MQLLELVPHQMSKLVVFLGLEITFLNGVSFKLLRGWRFDTWLASKCTFPAQVAFLISRCVDIVRAYLNVVSKQGNALGEVMAQLVIS